MDSQQDSTPEKIGGFRVLRRLATGGTSDVLLARAEGPHGFGRAVVLKVLLAQYRDDESFERMFAREAAAYARLSHPAIVRLFDFFSDAGQLVMVLELVDGLPLNKLRALLRGRGVELDDRASLFVASRIFAALAAAHGARDAETGEFAPVIHRDVNPSNVLIPWDGHVKLADFGIAKVAGMQSDTQAGFIKGTYGYMAPEQVRGESVTPRADVYAATLLLWELLTRRKAIQRGALPEMEVLRAMAEPQLPSLDVLRPDLPAALRDAVKRGLEPRPDKRAIFADELLAVLRGVTNLEEGRAVLVDALAAVRPPPATDDLEKTQESGPPPRASLASLPGDTDVGMREIAPDSERAPIIAEEALLPLSQRAPRPAPPLPPRPAPIARVALTQTLAMDSRPRAPPPPPAPMAVARPLAPPPSAIPPAPHFEMPSFPAPAELSFSSVPAALTPPPARVSSLPPPTAPPPVAYSSFLPPMPTPVPSPVHAFANGAPRVVDRSSHPLELRPQRRVARGWLGGVVGLLVASIVLVCGLVFLRARARGHRDGAHADRAPSTASAAVRSTPVPAASPVAPPPAAASTLAPAPKPTPLPDPPPPSRETSATMGDLDTSTARPQHRVWVDGRVVGQTPGVFSVPCGRRAVRIGSGGSVRTVEIPCGGQLKIGDH